MKFTSESEFDPVIITAPHMARIIKFVDSDLLIVSLLLSLFILLGFMG
jgi:hypothetical protein